MEFVMDEAQCRQLSEDMLTSLRTLAVLINDIDSQNGTLRAALGDDYEAIARSVRSMKTELGNAYSELNGIINDMSEYISRVHQARIALNINM